MPGGEPGEQPWIVAARPIELAAIATAIETVVMAPGQGGQPGCDLGLGHRRDGAVAGRAAAQGAGLFGEPEPFDHFAQLSARLDGAYPTAVVDDAPKEQPPVSGEHHPAFGGGQAGDLAIFPVVAPQGVEAEQAQVTGQPAQVHVHHETGRRGQGWAQGRPCTGQGGTGGKELDALTASQGVVEIHGPMVHQDQGHFGVGHAQGLDGVLDGRTASKRLPHPGCAARLGQAVEEFAMDAEPGGLLVIFRHSR